MIMDVIMQYFARYGGIAIFVIVLLEYLNLPGFPVGGKGKYPVYSGADNYGGGRAFRKSDLIFSWI